MGCFFTFLGPRGMGGAIFVDFSAIFSPPLVDGCKEGRKKGRFLPFLLPSAEAGIAKRNQLGFVAEEDSHVKLGLTAGMSHPTRCDDGDGDDGDRPSPTPPFT